jgi:ribonuclease-3
MDTTHPSEGEILDLLERRLGHRFTNAAIAVQAVTHSSAKDKDFPCNERLEFLGDHVLGLVISDMLFAAFPKADEGELSRRLADLVRKEACADVARAIDLGAVIRLGASENNAGGRNRIAILADVCEALVGAVFIDGGYKAASEVIGRLWEPRMRAPARPLRDSKTILQEWAQARGLPRIEGTAAWISCDVHELLPGGDHVIVVGLVTRSEISDNARPLVYHRRRFLEVVS